MAARHSESTPAEHRRTAPIPRMGMDIPEQWMRLPWRWRHSESTPAEHRRTAPIPRMGMDIPEQWMRLPWLQRHSESTPAEHRRTAPIPRMGMDIPEQCAAAPQGRGGVGGEGSSIARFDPGLGPAGGPVLHIDRPHRSRGREGVHPQRRRAAAPHSRGGVGGEGSSIARFDPGLGPAGGPVLHIDRPHRSRGREGVHPQFERRRADVGSRGRGSGSVGGEGSSIARFDPGLGPAGGPVLHIDRPHRSRGREGVHPHRGSGSSGRGGIGGVARRGGAPGAAGGGGARPAGRGPAAGVPPVQHGRDDGPDRSGLRERVDLGQALGRPGEARGDPGIRRGGPRPQGRGEDRGGVAGAL